MSDLLLVAFWLIWSCACFMAGMVFRHALGDPPCSCPYCDNGRDDAESE